MIDILLDRSHPKNEFFKSMVMRYLILMMSDMAEFKPELGG